MTDISAYTASAGTHILGLTSEEVDRRRAAGQGNPPSPPTTRSYLQIVRENVFTFVNHLLFALGFALRLVGRPPDGGVPVGVGHMNTLVSVIQEVRAKRILDRITVLARPMARVLRDGEPA